jgi:hypothetical protein
VTSEEIQAHAQFDTESPAPNPNDPSQAPASDPAVSVGFPLANVAADIRQKALSALSDIRASVPEHCGDLALGGLNGDLECAIAILKPRG